MYEGNHYKSWSGLKKQLTGMLCDELKDRISYNLVRYHQVHNSYGRVAILLDDRELAAFSWREMYQQDDDTGALWDFEKGTVEDGGEEILKEKWNCDATYSDYDFLEAATGYLQMPVKDALESGNYLIRIFAVMDRRVGRRTLDKIRQDGRYLDLPEWVGQFYRLRLDGAERGAEVK